MDHFIFPFSNKLFHVCIWGNSSSSYGPTGNLNFFWCKADSWPQCDSNTSRSSPETSSSIIGEVQLCCNLISGSMTTVNSCAHFSGVEKVKLDQSTKKVTVTGDIRPAFALSRAQRRKPESTFWDMRHCLN